MIPWNFNSSLIFFYCFIFEKKKKIIKKIIIHTLFLNSALSSRVSVSDFPITGTKLTCSLKYFILSISMGFKLSKQNDRFFFLKKSHWKRMKEMKSKNLRMSIWSNEIKTNVNTRISNLFLSGCSTFFFQVKFVLILNISDNWFPTNFY